MAKTIFHSSESSNFILNMTAEKYNKIASKVLLISCILVSLFAIPSEITQSVGYAYISSALAVCGVAGIITALIAVLKKYINKSMLIPLCSFGFMILWGILSLANSFNKNVAFYGFNGRGEGLLALIFYFCMFITAMTLTKENAIHTVMDSIVAMGLINTIWGMLQISDITSSFANNKDYYDYIPSFGNINAASGLCQSPMFLAMTLSIALMTAITGACICKSDGRRLIYTLSAILFSFMIMFTYTVLGICGIILSVVTAVILIIVKKKDKLHFAKIGCVIASSLLAVLLVVCNAVGSTGKYRTYDGNLMWLDSYNRLSSSGIYDNKTIDIKDTADVYSYLSSHTLGIIKEHPLVGTGEDNLIYTQMKQSYKIDENPGTFDRNYNEYLYTGATRGIPSMIALIVLIVSSIAIGVKKVKRNKNENLLIILLVTFCGAILLLIGNSNIVFSPIFWICAGICAGADIIKDEKATVKPMQINDKKGSKKKK